MYDCGYEDIPVFGENAAHDGLTTQIADIFDNIMSTNLRGVDFTDCSYLFDQAGNTEPTFFTLIHQAGFRSSHYILCATVTK